MNVPFLLVTGTSGGTAYEIDVNVVVSGLILIVLSAHINPKVQKDLAIAPANKESGKTQLPAKYLAGKLALLDVLIVP